MKNILYELLHTLILLACVTLGLLLGNASIGAMVGSVFFLGRELAQAEYRWIEHYGKGIRANMPYWGCVDPKVWNFHSLFYNLGLPILVGLLSGIGINIWLPMH